MNILGGFQFLEDFPNIIAPNSGSIQSRSLKSSKRYEKALTEVFLDFHNDTHQKLFQACMASTVMTEETKFRTMSLQFYFNDLLFRTLFNDCFLPIYKSGRIYISKVDIISFIYEKIRSDHWKLKWSTETIETVGRKYLSVMKKLGYLEGRAKKSIKEPYLGLDFLIFFHFWLEGVEENMNVLTSQFFPMLMISKEKYRFFMKQPEVREKLEWHFTGEKFAVEPKLTINEYVDELSS